MLPRINTQDGCVLTNDRVLVCVSLDQNLARLVILYEPCPAAPLDTRKRCVELALEVSEGAVGIVNGGLSQVVSYHNIGPYKS